MQRLLESDAFASTAWTVTICGIVLVFGAAGAFFACLLIYRVASAKVGAGRREAWSGVPEEERERSRL